MLRALLLLLLMWPLSKMAAQDFPLETVVCRQGSFTLENPLSDTAGLHFQWEQSFDGGGSWLPLNGEMDANLLISNPTTGISYRLRYAPTTDCLFNPSCASYSSATRLLLQFPEFFQSVAICDGDTAWVGNTFLTTAGNHTTVISVGECDSMVHTFLLIHPSYNQLYTASLCPGESFQGVEYLRDTSFMHAFTTQMGCDSVVTVEIDVTFPSNLSIEGPTDICAGEMAELSIDGQFSDFQWSNGIRARNIEVGEGGIYQLTITNSQGCALELTHELNVVDLSARVDAEAPSCPETATGALNIQAFGDTDLLYSFDGGASFGPDNFLGSLLAGPYEIVVESPLGCQWSSFIDLPDAAAINLLPNQGEQITIERGDSLAFDVGADFEVATWNWNTSFGLSCSDCPNPMARPLADVTYVLTATAQGGCTLEASFEVNVLDFRRAFAPNAFSPNMDGENDYWEIYLGPRAISVTGFTIFDRWGGTLYRRVETLNPGDEGLRWDGTIDGQLLAAGTYGYAATLHFQDGSSKVVSGTINLIR